MTENEIEIRKSKAKLLRFKKPIVREFNLYEIRSNLLDMQSDCSDVRWAIDGDGYDTLEEVLGDTDDVLEFKMTFSTLESDIDKLLEQMDDYSVRTLLEETYDNLMVAANGSAYCGGILGYDAYEEDYFPISGYDELCMRESRDRAKKLKKDDLLEAMQITLHVTFSYVGIKNRFDNLKAAMDIIQDRFCGQLSTIDELFKMYDEAQKSKTGWDKANQAFDRLCRDLSPETWLL